MRRSAVGVVGLLLVTALSACTSDEPQDDVTLPAVCQVLDDDVVRQAVGAESDVAVERNRDDGETECRYVAKEPGLSGLVVRIDTPSAGRTPAEAVEAMRASCPGGEALAGITATYCPNEDAESAGPFVQVAATPERVVVLSLTLAGQASDAARTGLTAAAQQVLARADTLS